MIDRWLALLCQLLPGVEQAVVVRRDGSVTSRWPDNADITALRQFCQSLGQAETAQFQQRESGVTWVAMPLHNRQVRVGTVAVALPLQVEQRVTTELLMRWSQAWLELLSDTNREKSAGFDTLLTLLEQGTQFHHIADNATAFATALVEKLSFAKALVCLPERGRIKVVGVSHAPQFDRRSEMFALLEDYLNTQPSADAPLTDCEYQRWLFTQQPALQFLLIALPPCGYLVLFFTPQNPPSAVAKAQSKQAARLLAPLFHSQNQLQQHFYWRWWDALREHFRSLEFRKKIAVSGAIAAVVLLILCLPGRHRVTAEAALEGKIQRAIVVPEDGYLLEAHVKAGESIQKGQILAQLDSKTIQLEIQRWLGEKQEYERQYNRELTALNPVEMRIAKAKLAQADAQLNLYRERLQRVRITAPIDGVIIKGDLSRAIGSPVQRGQVLYEMAPTDSFKLVMQIPEQSVRYVQQGQTGRLLLSAMPNTQIDFRVTSVASVYSADKPDIFYRAEAEIIGQTAAQLRPGMSGYVKIDVGKKAYGWLLGHRLWDWLVLKLWRF